MNILVTGAAGFIGFHSVLRLLALDHQVLGVDNLNAYYDVQLKLDRLQQLRAQPGFTFQQLDLGRREQMDPLFAAQRFDAIVHLGAQAGVRHSIDDPHCYLDSNLAGMLNVLEGARRNQTGHLVYASSSSVYGANRKQPFAVEDPTDQPVSLYAATKKANELMSHAYSHLYRIPMTGMRFFTVYGPWGRPDMAYYKFARAITHGTPIDLYNGGDMQRDFTYVDDVVDGIVHAVQRPPAAEQGVAHRVYNLGNATPEPLATLVDHLERLLGRKARRNLLPMQAGDVPSTCADIGPASRDLGYAPSTRLDQGLQRFVSWYRHYYRC